MNLPTESKSINGMVEANLSHPDCSVQLEDVSVRYRVPSERVRTFKEYMILRLKRQIQMKTFWALKGINITVSRGEIFGIVGDNGAGKSTLLKVIARVLRPTAGRVIITGNVAPLLELGAGFHPELTGKENIFLNGALLGFSNRDMQEKFDEIVEFSELGEFINAPIRTYSTGMFARLGFAVATASEPDILIVDEVLGVGDETFQKKCETRINDYCRRGTTILLVSHSMAKVESMCHRAAWLDHGILKTIGDPGSVVTAYRQKEH
jgi:ABC-2 type transport system ATP-binding protein